MNIRLLTEEDWKIWKDIRLQALQNSPESFASSYEEELNWQDSDFQNTLSKNQLLGAFVNDVLVSCAGFYLLNSLKTKHRGVIWGMYTRPEYRRRGIAKALMKTLLHRATANVTQLHLTCVTNNLDAITFYLNLGFKIYGTEPRALKINNTFFDEHLMILELTRDPMKKFSTYQNLCTEVYDLSKPNAPEDAYSFYRSYAIAANGPILEPMCGTGRFLLPLLEEGFDIHGFDASKSMLERLKIKANTKNCKPSVWTGFIEDLKRPEKYHLIFIPSGSFGLITELAAVKKALKTIYNHLDEKGVFVFEVETFHAVPKELGVWRGSRWQRSDGKIILHSQLATLDGPLCYSIGKYEFIDQNHIIQTEVEEYKIRIYDEPSLLLDMLAEAGFSNVRLVKAFDRSASVQTNDESIVYECRK